MQTSTPSLARSAALPARILIVDDHPVIRGGILRLIAEQPDLVCCAEASGAAEALALALERKPDLAIVDLRLKQGDGFELIKALRAQLPRLRVLVLSQHTQPVFIERAFRAGALGYVAKDQDPSEVLTALRTILEGRLYVTRVVAAHLLQNMIGVSSNALPPSLQRLTDRELVVLHLLGEGQTTREIAEQLSLSVKTIESHRENIKHKLQLKDATQLLHFASSWAAQLAALPIESLQQPPDT